jgi:hypothetical protein
MTRLRSTRLRVADISVDVRWTCIDERWIASADLPDGPSLGLGWTPQDALTAALDPLGAPVPEVPDSEGDD